MRTHNTQKENEREEFAHRAALYFVRNPTSLTYTDAQIKVGCWFAMRWEDQKDCVVVFKLDEDEEPVNYLQIVEK